MDWRRIGTAGLAAIAEALPLRGTADPDRFAQDLAALEIALTAEQVEALSAAPGT